MSLHDALQKLASYRTKNTRKSRETFESGLSVLNAGKLGDAEWDILEQLALASIDVGRLDIADKCLQTLDIKFPSSPRVSILTGIRMEASDQPPSTVLAYYDHLLLSDPTNMASWKRRISILRRMPGSIDKAVVELNELLDTVYLDLEGWLELADLYSECNQYTSSLQALSHALLLAPQNPFTLLQFAETAYTAGDIPLALKTFLVVIDMNDAEDSHSIPKGISIRAWWGIKLCTRHLLSSSFSESLSKTPIPANLNLIDELATERVLAAYSSSSDSSDEKKPRDAQTRKLVLNWMSAK